jgi:lipoate-protein ligase A
LKRLNIRANLLSEGAIGVNGLKISGTARTLRKGAYLHHGSLLVNSDLDFLQKVLLVKKIDNFKKCLGSKKSPVTSLERELGKKINVVKVKEALINGFEAVFNMNLNPSQLSTDEVNLAKRLFDEKYNSNDWNFQR